MKITFVRSNTNAVGEYRVHHPMLALRALGHDCNMLTLSKVPQKVANTELAGDLVVLQRQTSESVFDLLATLPSDDRPRVVYEVDDNPWEWHPWDSIHAELGYDYGKRVREVMGRCDAVTCSTPTLAARVRREFPDMPIWVVPNAIDYRIRDWTPADASLRQEQGLEGRTVLGWTGSIHHTRDGQALLKSLPTVFETYPDTVFLMQCDRSVYYEWTRELARGSYKDRLRWVPPLPFDVHPKIYSLFDINLAPLEVTSFNVCKSDLRLIEGGAQGVPYVASKIAPYLEFHKRNGGIGGYLADTPAEWVAGISHLLDGEREARGQSMKRYVQEVRSLEVVAGTWQAAYEGVLALEKGEEVRSAVAGSRNAPCPCGQEAKYKRCCEPAYG